MPKPVAYDPAICLVVQGAKRVLIGDQEVRYATGMHFIWTIEDAGARQHRRGQS